MKPIAEVKYHSCCLRLFVAGLELATEGNPGNIWEDGEGSEDGICWSPAGLQRAARHINGAAEAIKELTAQSAPLPCARCRGVICEHLYLGGPFNFTETPH